MVKDDTIIMLTALGIGAYILYKPIQGTGQGIQTGVQGIGTGVSTAFQGVGEGLGEIGQGVGSLFGYVDERLQIAEDNAKVRQEAQEENLKLMWATQSQEQLEKAQTDLLKSLDDRNYELERNQSWEQYKNDILDFFTFSPQELASSVSNIWNSLRGKNTTNKLPKTNTTTPLTQAQLSALQPLIMPQAQPAAWADPEVWKKVPETGDTQKTLTQVKTKSSSSSIKKVSSSSTSKSTTTQNKAIEKYHEQAKSSPELAANLKVLGW